MTFPYTNKHLNIDTISMEEYIHDNIIYNDDIMILEYKPKKEGYFPFNFCICLIPDMEFIKLEYINNGQLVFTYDSNFREIELHKLHQIQYNLCKNYNIIKSSTFYLENCPENTTFKLYVTRNEFLPKLALEYAPFNTTVIYDKNSVKKLSYINQDNITYTNNKLTFSTHKLSEIILLKKSNISFTDYIDSIVINNIAKTKIHQGSSMLHQFYNREGCMYNENILYISPAEIYFLSMDDNIRDLVYDIYLKENITEDFFNNIYIIENGYMYRN